MSDIQSNSPPPKPPLPLPPIHSIQTPYYHPAHITMPPTQISLIYCNTNNRNNANMSNHNNNNLTHHLSFPSLNYDEPHSNTPESDDHSIISANTVNTNNTATTTTTTNIASLSPNLHSFGINDVDDEDDDDLYIPPISQSHKKCKKKKKCKKHSKKLSTYISADVLPLAGHGSIGWNDVCKTSLECHLCHKIYNDRAKYIECLKTHYNDDDNELVYLECELCLAQPTKKNLAKKDKLCALGLYNNSWRTSKHVANFISHLAGHDNIKPGFYCKVQVYDEEMQQYVTCNAPGSTQQNLAKHIYNMHYKMSDKSDKYCIDPTYGYVSKNKLKKLQKKKNKKRKKIKKNFIDYDDLKPKRKKRRLNKKKCSETIIGIGKGNNYNEVCGDPYTTLQQQHKFYSYLTFAAAPKLALLADIACGSNSI